MNYQDIENTLFEEHGLEVTIEPAPEETVEMVRIAPWPMYVPADSLEDPEVRRWIANKIKRDGRLREV